MHKNEFMQRAELKYGIEWMNMQALYCWKYVDEKWEQYGL